jgi:hypothetical protein
MKVWSGHLALCEIDFDSFRFISIYFDLFPFISIFPMSFPSFIFKPVFTDHMETCSSFPIAFYIRVLGRCDIRDALAEKAAIDVAMPMAPPG